MQSDLQSSAEAFGASLQQMADTFEADLNTIVRTAIFKLLVALMEDNPKDTCRSAASWMVGPGWTDWVEPEGDYRDFDPAARAKEIMDALSDSDVYCLYNNIEYLMALEDGHSQRAPSGFIANDMTAFAEFMAQAAQAMGYSL